MKKMIYILLVVLIAISFTGCKRNNRDKDITCKPTEKENTFCNYNLDPVCGDDGQTYGNACIACASNNIDSYKMGECRICDDETGICNFGDVWYEEEFSDEIETTNQEVKEVFIEVPTPKF